MACIGGKWHALVSNVAYESWPAKPLDCIFEYSGLKVRAETSLNKLKMNLLAKEGVDLDIEAKFVQDII